MSANNEHRIVVEITKEQFREMIGSYLIAKFGIQTPMFGKITVHTAGSFVLDGPGNLVVSVVGAQQLKATR